MQPGEELQDHPARDSSSDPPSWEAQYSQPPLSCQLPVGQVHLKKKSCPAGSRDSPKLVKGFLINLTWPPPQGTPPAGDLTPGRKIRPPCPPRPLLDLVQRGGRIPSRQPLGWPSTSLKVVVASVSQVGGKQTAASRKLLVGAGSPLLRGCSWAQGLPTLS